MAMKKQALDKKVNYAAEVGKEEALRSVLEKIDKQFGQGAIMRMGENEKLDINVIPTGITVIDKALGVGGIPKGRITEIYGPESSGKTTVALHVIAQSQKQGGTVAFIDAEHALDPTYAKAIGVDTDNLLISQPDYGEQALEICSILARSGAVDLIVIDSVAALTPKVEIEGNMGDTHVGLLARLMSQAMRKLTAEVSNAGCTVVFINQVREKIGTGYGNPEVTTGGRALRFYASIRMEVRKASLIKQGDNSVGNGVNIRISKNKVAPPFKTAAVDLLYGTGLSNESGLLDLGSELGIVKKSGAWYSYNGEQLGQGRDNARIFLTEHPDIAKEISERIMTSETNIPVNVENEPEDETIENGNNIESNTSWNDFDEDIQDFGEELSEDDMIG